MKSALTTNYDRIKPTHNNSSKRILGHSPGGTKNDSGKIIFRLGIIQEEIINCKEISNHGK